MCGLEEEAGVGGIRGAPGRAALLAESGWGGVMKGLTVMVFERVLEEWSLLGSGCPGEGSIGTADRGRGDMHVIHILVCFLHSSPFVWS